MRVIETTAHVGPDGILRLALSTEQRNQDVKVAVVVETVPSAVVVSTIALVIDRWADVREKLEAAGFRVPPPGVENTGQVVPQDLPGMSASEMLVSDRR